MKPMDGPACVTGRVRVGPPRGTPRKGRRWGVTCDASRRNSVRRVIGGTARGSRRICACATGWRWGGARATESSATGDSGCASPAPKSPSPTRSRARRLHKRHRLARRRGGALWSVDECHVHPQGTRCRMGVPPEIKDPVLLHAPTRKSVACVGAVSVRTGTCIRSLCATFNAATVEPLLKTRLRQRARDTRRVLVRDNARDHHAVRRTPLLRTYRAVRTLLVLPPYRPHLAPVERVGTLARRMATHHRFFATVDDVLTAVATCFDRWRTPNSVRRRLCGII